MELPHKSMRTHKSYLAFIGHRISGLLLALFLPVHFLVLGLALEGAESMDRFLTLAELPMVKFAEWGLVCLLYTSPSPRDATLSRMPSSA